MKRNNELKALIRDWFIHPWDLDQRPRFDWLTNWANEGLR
jgi:hypothetical protein